jgi:hypothetical protein
LTERPNSNGAAPFTAALNEIHRGAWQAAAALMARGIDWHAPDLASGVEAVVRMHDAGVDVALWKPLQERLISTLGPRRDILWARLRLLDSSDMQQISGPPLQVGRWLGKDPNAVRIARELGTEDDYCRTLLVYDWHGVDEINFLLERARGWAEENLARVLSVAAETLMYRHGAFDRACVLLEEERALHEQRGSVVDQAKSLVRTSMALLAAGRLAQAFVARSRAHEMVERLGPAYLIKEHAGTARGGDLYPEISMESNFAWYVEGNWRAVAKHWVDAVALEESGGSPVHIVEAAMAAQAYARLGEDGMAAFYLDELTVVLRQLKPRDWAFNGAVGRASHAIWDMQARRYAEEYRAMALAMLAAGVGDWTNTSLEQTVARMAALQGDANQACDYFTKARHRLAGPGDPRTAILDFDEAVAARICPAHDLGRRHALLDAAIAGFAQNAMEGWLERAARERAKIG